MRAAVDGTTQLAESLAISQAREWALQQRPRLKGEKWKEGEHDITILLNLMTCICTIFQS